MASEKTTITQVYIILHYSTRLGSSLLLPMQYKYNVDDQGTKKKKMQL